MGLFQGFWSFLANFSKRMMASSTENSPDKSISGYTFGSYQGRMVRYDINWSYYENNTYDETNRWLYNYMREYKMFTETEGLFNPFYRLVEFWATHLMGGPIDPECGDGERTETAIPIMDADDKTRKSIAKMFADSKWEINKSVWCRFGAAMGDVALEAIIDVKRRQIRLNVIDPRTVADVQQFSNGDTKSYEIQEWFEDPRVDPEQRTSNQAVLYREKVDIFEGRVRYRTYIGDEPYPWYEKQTWYLDQDFIPMVFHAHKKVSTSSPFGWCEGHAALPKVRRLNDVASRLFSSIGKNIDCIWLFSGVSPNVEVQMPKDVITGNETRSPIDEIPALYGTADAKAQALVSTLDIPGVIGMISALQEDLKQDYPELRPDIESAIGDASGKALRVARQRCEAKANAIRPGYDAMLTACLSMGIAMGSRLGFEGYAGLPTDPRKVKFRIGKRSVFATDPMDRLEQQEKFWQVAESADRAGLPLPGYMEYVNRPDVELKLVDDSRKEAMDAGLEVGRSKQPSPQGDAAVKASQVPGATKP